MEIREYSPEDFETIWRLDQECFPPGIAYSRFELMHYLRRRSAFALIAEQKAAGEATGVAAFLVAEWRSVRHRNPEGQEATRNVGHIITLDVRDRARRRGVGTRLMDEGEHRLQTLGCEVVYLETAVNNLPAISFYKRRGYAVLKTIPHYYEGKLDALLMGKALPRTRGAEQKR